MEWNIRLLGDSRNLILIQEGHLQTCNITHFSESNFLVSKLRILTSIMVNSWLVWRNVLLDKRRYLDKTFIDPIYGYLQGFLFALIVDTLFRSNPSQNSESLTRRQHYCEFTVYLQTHLWMLRLEWECALTAGL